MTPDSDLWLRGGVAEYLEFLREGDFESAFHGLTCLPPSVVPLLISAYNDEISRDVRSGLLRIIWEFRTPLAVPLLEASLRDRGDDSWKDALDGMVTLASPQAIDALERLLAEAQAQPRIDSNYVDWVREALEQTREAHANPPLGDVEPSTDAVAELPFEDVLDLHGFRPRDVREIVQRYLDDADAAGFSAVRIVHGRGMGVQRATVRALLSRDERVIEFSDAPESQGGRGATLVQLRRKRSA